MAEKQVDRKRSLWFTGCCTRSMLISCNSRFRCLSKNGNKHYKTCLIRTSMGRLRLVNIKLVTMYLSRNGYSRLSSLVPIINDLVFDFSVVVSSYFLCVHLASFSCWSSSVALNEKENKKKSCVRFEIHSLLAASRNKTRTNIHHPQWLCCLRVHIQGRLMQSMNIYI